MTDGNNDNIEVTRQLLSKLRKFLIKMDDDTSMAAAVEMINITWTSFAAGGYKEKMLSLMDQLRMKPFLYPQFLEAIADERPDLDWQPFGGPAPVTPELPDQPTPQSPEPTFANFDLLVTAAGPQQYFVRGSHDVGGGAGANAVQTLDLQAPELQAVLKFLAFLSADNADTKSLGQKLFEFLFPLKIYAVFSNLYATSRREGHGVRLRLQIEAADLHYLPWELLYDPHNDEFLARNHLTPVVRYIERNYVPHPLQTDGQLRILVVVASPQNKPQLDAPAELKALRNALFAVRDRVHLDLLDRATKTKLQQQVSTFSYDVVHYIGHGHFENGSGYLLLEDENRQADPLSTGLLKDVLRNRGIKVAVLNACDTATTGEDAPAFASVAQGLVSADIPAVIAMQTKIPDYLSLKITALLYGYLAYGQPLDRVITEMRIGAATEARPEHQALWGTPVIYMQPPNGRLWTNPPQPVPDLVQTISFEPEAAELSLGEQLKGLQPRLLTAAAGLNPFAREEIADGLTAAVTALEADPPQWDRAVFKIDGLTRDLAAGQVALEDEVESALKEIRERCKNHGA